MHYSKGVKIISIPTVNCNACRRLKLKRLIRRAPREIYKEPRERVAINFYNYKERSSIKKKTQILIMCRVTRLLYNFYLKDYTTYLIT
jgi:hypothetical protein